MTVLNLTTGVTVQTACALIAGTSVRDFFLMTADALTVKRFDIGTSEALIRAFTHFRREAIRRHRGSGGRIFVTPSRGVALDTLDDVFTYAFDIHLVEWVAAQAPHVPAVLTS